MTKFVTKPAAMDVPETWLRLVALDHDAPIDHCRIRKCLRNRRCSGEMIASDGRLEALAPTEHAAMAWFSGAGIPPCFCNMSEHRLSLLAREMPEAHKTLAGHHIHGESNYILWKTTRLKYRDRIPGDRPKKPG